MFLQQNGLKDKYVQAQVMNNWGKFVGAPIANRTDEIYIKDKVLVVKTQSSSVKSQLGMMKQALVAMIASKYGPGIVQDIRVF